MVSSNSAVRRLFPVLTCCGYWAQPQIHQRQTWFIFHYSTISLQFKIFPDGSFQVCYQKVWWELRTSKWTPGCHVKLGCDHLTKKLQPFNHLCLAIIKLEHNLTLKLPSFKNYISCLNINLSLNFVESSAGLFYFLVKIRANPVWPFDPSTLGLQLKFNVKFPTQLTILYVSYILISYWLNRDSNTVNTAVNTSHWICFCLLGVQSVIWKPY